MKSRILLLLILGLFVFTLSACNETVYTLTVETNIESLTVDVSEEEGKSKQKTYVLSAPVYDGYQFNHWYNETTDEILTQYSSMVFTPTEDTIIRAVYSPIIVINTYQVTVSSNIGEDVTSICNTVNIEYQCTLQAPTYDGYTFVHWYDSVSSTILSTDINYTFIATSNRTIQAMYEAVVEVFDITVTSNITEATIQTDKTENTVTLTAPVVTGYTFLHFKDTTDGTLLSTDNPYQFVLTDDLSVTAVYVIDLVLYTITTSSNTTGVTLDVTQTDNSVTLEAPNVTGYTFIHWYDNTNNQVLSTSNPYIFTLSENLNVEAIYNQDNVTYNIITDLNISGDAPTVSQTDNNVTLTAATIDGYDFVHWYDETNAIILSTSQIYSFTLTENISVNAIYQAESTGTVTLFYSTGFEDASKTSYAEGTVTLSSQTWTLYEALIGDLATDLDVSGKSVRIKNGYIDTEFTVTDLAQVSFYAGTYGSDDDHTVRLEISLDGTTWVVVDSFTSTGVMTEYEYVFDSALYTSLSLDSTSPYYIRIVSETDERLNVDDVEIYTGDGNNVVDDTPLYTINLDTNFVYTYQVNDTIDLSGCTATHETTGDTTCDVSGTVDNTTPGVYDITFSKTDEFGHTASMVIQITILSNNSDLLSMDLISYYDDAEGLYGESLIDALNTILNTGFTGVTYGSARYILDETDQDPNNSSNLILVYLGTSVNGAWDNGVTWNREHIWPQSLLGESADNGTVNSASDLYNLMPANPNENSSRGNTPYNESPLGYEPRDEVKGDIARALFYMMVMYEQLELVNTAPTVYQMAYLDVLIQWHYDDPVDAFEQHRMDVIISYQGNRNPFVDYPHFVELIWSYNPS